ncbi:MAG TPA: hypothetical protein VG940_01120 [Gemmatimonadales bacterium]|nr:hypothetical protein [Gemmatimonadales bacterium]
MTAPSRFEEKTERWLEVPIGVALLLGGAAFAFYGGKGLWAWLHGSHAAPATPYAWVIGLGAAAWMGSVGLRLVTGRRRDEPLVPDLLILIGSLAAIALALGGAVVILLAGAPGRLLPGVIVLMIMGITGVKRWRRPAVSPPGDDPHP